MAILHDIVEKVDTNPFFYYGHFSWSQLRDQGKDILQVSGAWVGFFTRFRVGGGGPL